MIPYLSQEGPVVRGFSVDFFCKDSAGGNLPISYTWTDPDGQILFSADTDGNISLAINIFGNYTCSGTNAVGTDTASVEVVQAGMHGASDMHDCTQGRF